MSRPRSPKNRSLPPYLYVYKGGAKTYYSYRHPKTGTLFSMGSDRAAAIQAAQTLNSKLMSADAVDLVSKVLGGGKLFSEILDEHLARQDERGLSEKTRYHREWRLTVLKEAFGKRAIADITTQQIATFLDTRTASMANMFRSDLKSVFMMAITKGYIEKNPVVITEVRSTTVQRGRLSQEQFDAVYALAPAHVQNAMMLGLLTLQRRQDIVDMKFSDIHDGFLHVVQSKTGQKLRIKLNPLLDEVIDRCRSTGVESEFLIHHVNDHLQHKQCDAGRQLNPQYLSVQFRSLWLKAGFLEAGAASFHEIRSLGARLLEAQGVDPQKILGHKSRKMTEMYLHDRGSEWVEVG